MWNKKTEKTLGGQPYHYHESHGPLATYMPADRARHDQAVDDVDITHPTALHALADHLVEQGHPAGHVLTEALHRGLVPAVHKNPTGYRPAGQIWTHYYPKTKHVGLSLLLPHGETHLRFPASSELYDQLRSTGMLG